MSISIGAPLGYLEGDSSTRDFERWMKEALGFKKISQDMMKFLAGLRGAVHQN
jgi:hypothetical protein